MKTTFFKVDRDIQNNWLWNDKPFARGQAWIDLLLLATHTDRKTFNRGQLVDKKRGEVHVSIGFLCDRWGWSKTKVKTFLKTLEDEKMVLTKSTTQGTIIFIEKYAFYQGDYTTKRSTEMLSKSTSEVLSKSTSKSTSEVLQTIKDKESKRMINNGLRRGGLQVRTDHDDILNNPLLSEEAKKKWIDIRESMLNRKKVDE